MALVNDENEIDSIPLHEVSEVRETPIDKGGPSHSAFMKLQKSQHEKSKAVGKPELLRESFNIETIPDGHNSGQHYYLRAGSRREGLQHIETLRTLAKDAALRGARTALARSRRDAVHRLYVSGPFQCLAAMLIVAVGMNPCLTCVM